jgi:hypothetical protein
MSKRQQPQNLVVISDLHAGSQLAVCPLGGTMLDNGGVYRPSALQVKLWKMWEQFWGWADKECAGESWDVVNNGDSVDGFHHGTTETITNNLTMQKRIAAELLSPVVARCHKSGGRYYHIRGTPAHSGEANSDEEALAKELGALPDENKNYARFELRKDLDGSLIHFMHHVGTTSSAAYEATAVNKELTESLVESARWGQRHPDMICRAHRHRFIQIMIPTSSGRAFAVVGPAWQAKTSFCFKVAGARISLPQFGGYIVRKRHGVLHTLEKIWSVDPSPIEY